MASEAAAESNDDAKDPVAAIGDRLRVLSTGDHALLRRMILTRKVAADGVVVKLLHHAGVGEALYGRDYPAWALLVHAAALLSGTEKRNPHAPHRALGTALHAAGLSENRLLRLTVARGPALADQIMRAVRMLAQAGEVPVDLRPLLQLAGSDAAAAERARIRIAQSYYAAKARREGEAK